MSVDDIGVGAVDEVDLPSVVRGEIAWDSQVNGSIITRNVLGQAQDGRWPVVGLEVAEVDGEGLSIGVDGGPLDGELLALCDGCVEDWGQDLVGRGGGSQKGCGGEGGELHYELM